jgi:soluble lytic murein transglycosylase-like protein
MMRWPRLTQEQRQELWATVAIACLLLVIGLLWSGCASAAEMPRAALKYRADLTREARQVWGLNAPIPIFAAQIHQESGWNPQAVSRVGAKGMAQFMPATARWIATIDPALANAEATNPRWAIRALVRYDGWLVKRVQGDSEFNLLWAALRAYNGGLGHWQMEAKVAQSTQRQAVDAACGQAKRHASFCPENLGYPHRILTVLQPLYLSWGRGVQL